jgi:AraC-like DNA-binding protein
MLQIEGRSMKKIEVGENLFEVTPHGDYGFPFFEQETLLSEYEHGSFAVHWHPEVELTVVLKGAMEYQANQAVYRLTGGSGVFVNANCLHTARSYEGQDCKYLAFTFDPVLVYGHENSTVEKKYADPVTDSTGFSSLYLDPEREPHREMLRIFREIDRVYTERADGYELRIKGLLCEFWLILYGEFRRTEQTSSADGKNIGLMKQMLNYIHGNYAGRVTLQDLADSCHVSKSKCCHYFRETMRQTPFEYLLKYRIQKSLPYLLQRSYSITEISEKTGFAGASYYAEVFRKCMLCSPSEYRKKHLSGE